MFSHQTLGILAVLISIIGFVPYLKGIYNGKVRPHFFGWLIWSILTLMVFCAQLTSGAGAGAWMTGVICLSCIIVTLVSIFRGETSRTTFDWVCLGFVLGLLSLQYLYGQQAARRFILLSC